MSERLERLRWLNGWLVRDMPGYAASAAEFPADDGAAQWALFRSLVNVRPARPAAPEFLARQDALLQANLAARGVTRACELPQVRPGVSLWRGDITTLAADAVVNAANSGLTGCYLPLHRCIDNAIHTYAGVQLRLECARLVEARGGRPEPTGRAQITGGHNLPARHVLHTVGPVVPDGRPTARQRAQLASCYRACLDLAAACGLRSVAFCCVSTGEFRFPREQAARIAVGTVERWLAEHGDAGEDGEAPGKAVRRDGASGPGGSGEAARQTCTPVPARAAAPAMHVIFDVFTDADEAAYRALLA